MASDEEEEESESESEEEKEDEIELIKMPATNMVTEKEQILKKQ